MDTEHLQETLDMLATTLECLVEAHYQRMVEKKPISLSDQLRWARTLQQFGRDTDVLCEACATLIRRLHDSPQADLALR